MKYNILISLVVVFSCLTMIGCQKPCKQIYDQSEKPEIKKDEYNSCNAILANYIYVIDNANDFPYWEHQGDTVKVCGWMVNKNISKGMLYLTDNPKDTTINDELSSPWLGVEVFGLDLNLSDMNFSKKCYVTGKLRFLHPIGGDGNPNKRYCYYYPLVINAISVYFE